MVLVDSSIAFVGNINSLNDFDFTVKEITRESYYTLQFLKPIDFNSLKPSLLNTGRFIVDLLNAKNSLPKYLMSLIDNNAFESAKTIGTTIYTKMKDPTIVKSSIFV